MSIKLIIFNFQKKKFLFKIKILKKHIKKMFDYKVKYKFNQTIPYSVELSSQSQLTIALFIFTSTFSITTNFLNILVFLNSKMKCKNTYKRARAST